jgi:Rrf2 family transcriptional regulator, iron-sulfur cluster assembly transcription factor
MRLSNKGVYAVRAMFDLAFYGEDAPVQVKDIAERQCIPSRFLEQILQTLKRAELVKSKRGPGGGYVLGREASQINLAHVLRALGELPQMAQSADIGGEGQVLVADLVCGELLDEMIGLLENTTLFDLRQRGFAMGLSRGAFEDFVYVI